MADGAALPDMKVGGPSSFRHLEDPDTGWQGRAGSRLTGQFPLLVVCLRDTSRGMGVSVAEIPGWVSLTSQFHNVHSSVTLG